MKRKEIFEEYWDGFNASDSYRRHKFPDLEVTMISNRTNKTKFKTSYVRGKLENQIIVYKFRKIITSQEQLLDTWENSQKKNIHAKRAD